MQVRHNDVARGNVLQAMGEDVWEEFDQRRLIPQVGSPWRQITGSACPASAEYTNPMQHVPLQAQKCLLTTLLRQQGNIPINVRYHGFPVSTCVYHNLC
jgi:hypothetical protein